jgi:hypothetical protein
MACKVARGFTVAALIGSVLASSPVLAAGRMVRLRTAALTAPAGGYLYCKVTASSTKPIGIVATIVDAQRRNLTAYGSGFRASPEATDDGRYYAEETAGTVPDASGAEITGSCRADVTDARRADITITLTAFDASGEEVRSLER